MRAAPPPTRGTTAAGVGTTPLSAPGDGDLAAPAPAAGDLAAAAVAAGDGRGGAAASAASAASTGGGATVLGTTIIGTAVASGCTNSANTGVWSEPLTVSHCPYDSQRSVENACAVGRRKTMRSVYDGVRASRIRAPSAAAVGGLLSAPVADFFRFFVFTEVV